MTRPENRPDGNDITARLLNLIFDMTLQQKLKLLDHLDNSQVRSSRRHARKPWIIPVNFKTQNRVYNDVIKDISAGGVFIETKFPFAAGQDITMKFRLPKSQRLIQAVGKIVRSNPLGIGVKFKRQTNGS